MSDSVEIPWCLPGPNLKREIIVQDIIVSVWQLFPQHFNGLLGFN